MEHARWLMIPLPEKVYLQAESAEAIAWNALDDLARTWSRLKHMYAGRLGTSESLGDELVSQAAMNQVLSRTYLSFGWKYRHRALRNNHPNSIHQIVRQLETPRFVYVTEFATVPQTTGNRLYERRITSHCVIDATAKNQDIDSILLFHAPGYCVWHSHGDRNRFQRFTAVIENDTIYFPKARGEMNFVKFGTLQPLFRDEWMSSEWRRR
jgi:hypothetical protein